MQPTHQWLFFFHKRAKRLHDNILEGEEVFSTQRNWSDRPMLKEERKSKTKTVARKKKNYCGS
jgi:uncharacterized membrane protein YbaN (DUF454 family)